MFDAYSPPKEDSLVFLSIKLAAFWSDGGAEMRYSVVAGFIPAPSGGLYLHQSLWQFMAGQCHVRSIGAGINPATTL